VDRRAPEGGKVSADSKKAEEQVRLCYSTWAQSYHADYYASAGAYPPVHQDIVRDVLKRSGARTLLDAGCGPASMLRSLTDLNLELYGFDLTPEMVAEARRVMKLPAERLWVGSVTDPSAYGAPMYDAAICIGVLPHVPENTDQAVVENLFHAVKPGGTVMLEARNELFALFTQNRYTYELIATRLVPTGALGSEGAKALEAMKTHFRMDLPPVRKGKSGEPGYDEVLSRTHNPFELRTLFATAGFRDVEVFFYHYHCLPPMFERGLPELFRRQSVAMEDPRDWRGHFMASAFIVCGKRP
jgi:2-polyprenyl-3-methyl-5-hydroxy-6-metoxy-1,4-benzoquinol methylase